MKERHSIQGAGPDSENRPKERPMEVNSHQAEVAIAPNRSRYSVLEDLDEEVIGLEEIAVLRETIKHIPPSPPRWVRPR